MLLQMSSQNFLIYLLLRYDHPHCLIGQTSEVIEKIQRRREEFGINYITFGGAAIDEWLP